MTLLTGHNATWTIKIETVVMTDTVLTIRKCWAVSDNEVAPQNGIAHCERMGDRFD